MKKKDVHALIDRWVAAGQVSAEQAAYMKSDVAAVTSERSSNRFISAVVYVGAIGLSLGALLIIASNWEGLSKGVKLLLALLLPILPLSFAYWQLVLKDQSRILGQSANVLGLALIGGSLAIIGQTYNLESNMVSFLWSWAILTVPFLFVFKRTENMLFSATMIGIAGLFSIFDFLEQTTMDDGTALLLVTIASLGYAYLVYAIGNILRNISPWEESSRFLRLGAAGLSATVLFVTTFSEYAKTVTGSTYRNPANWEALSFVFNVIFIGFLIFALLRTIKLEEYSYAFSIVRLFCFYLLVKYFTLFYSMFDTGVFFMIGGVLFITGGWLLEKKKDVLISYMREEVNHE